jgi:hypothetical protein
VFGVPPPLLLKLPPAPPSDHTAPVAPPPYDPPSAADVPLWHIAVIDPPALTVGFLLTVIVFVSVTVPHDPPCDVSVSVTVPENVDEAV